MVGATLVVLQGVLLAVQGLLEEDGGLSLTTAVSMLVAYGIGVLVASGLVVEGVAVAVLSSLLLVLKRELHTFAWGLSREELRSAAEFSVLAFVVLPLLPEGEVGIALGGQTIAVEPRVVWLMVVAGGVAKAGFGTVGFYATAAVTGLVSSAGATTSAILLYRAETLTAGEAVLGVLIATGASIAVKVALTVAVPQREFALRVALWSTVVLLGGGIAALAMVL